MTGAIDVYRDLRTWWLRRGADYWTDDPTDRSGPGWIRVDQLGSDPERLGRIVEDYGDRIGTATRKAAAALLGKRFSAMLAFPPTVAWMQWERVPTVRPDTTWLRFDDRMPTRVAVDEIHATVLADDRLAGSDDCDVLDRQALREHLASTAYDATMGAAIDALHTCERTGTRHLWGNVSLTAVNSALWAADAPDPWARGEALCASRDVLARTQELIACERDDTGPYLVALRKTCCLAYEVESHGYCASCSLVDTEQRLATLPDRIGDAWRDRIRWTDDPGGDDAH
ncbi:MAG: (2Fe-2S)-binding protein [Actinomycetota bacterium]